MSRVLPDTPAINGVIEREGSEYLFSTYFADGFNPKPDAPEEIKREAALLRDFFAQNGPLKRIPT